MMSGRIRPIETREVTLQAPTIDETREQARGEVPEGWDLTDAAATMPKASTMITLNAKMARRDGVQEIEADDIASLRAKVPEGWQLLNVREV
ncbi:hypothetical protein PU630_08980 [Microbacterium horticulturae]|uniref:Uncharacterized protein n=1 Tax=Microbacterium horticulturae TaxID=3028316 RepID=A0ABY8BTB1_9MICO|nr:hypothetical protein [Microbacterium sp. KACC 23027]WEG07403.1 hypothetical protein PU630_08980 [Microbacterium sp. KACC 23027]